MRFLLCFLALAGPLGAAYPGGIARPSFENTHATNSSAKSGVVSFNSGIVRTNPPSSENNEIKEYAFGQPFVPYATPYESPSSSFADDVLFEGRTVGETPIAAVYPKLYPAGFGKPSGVTISKADLVDPAKGGAFRYRWLMYGPDPDDTDGDPAILNLFANQDGDTNDWFTENDRETAISQIDVLREALALDPLNRKLQSALLDTYYDLSVAEMQLVRRQLVLLGRIRLGLDTPPTFIIDEEIKFYEAMIKRTGKVLELYGELFSFQMEGFNPSDLFSGTIASDSVDPSRGAPFGYFIFQNQVPLRNQVISQFATSDPNVVVNIIDPGEQNIFQGFKDYRSLLTILGQYIQFQSDLAILRGKRMADTPDGPDITLARQGLQDAQEAASIATMLNMMFYQPMRWTGSMDQPVPIDFDDPAFEATGVSAAKEAVLTALNSSTDARNFTNGVTNSLGLDPNFLLLVPAQPSLDLGEKGQPFDSYDVLAYKMTEKSGDTNIGPLAVAKRLLGDPSNPLTGGGAIQAYKTFRESVDRVSIELAALDDGYAERFVQITGYDYASEGDQWDGITPNPVYQQPGTDQPSELHSANEAIASLQRQQVTLRNVQASFAENVAAAQKAVSIAKGIAPKIYGATSTYINKTFSTYLQMGIASAASAAADAATDGVLAATGLENPLSLGPKAAAIAVASTANALVQSGTAAATTGFERDLDHLAVIRDADIDVAGAELDLQESILTLGELQREAESIKLEVESLKASLSQTVNERTALLREVERMTANLRADRKSLAKRYYSDPIHFIRSEASILEADASFRNAQRWSYFTCRALEHKWNQKFKYASQGDVALGISYDIAKVFSARNALELERLLQKMAEFNLARITAVTQDKDAVISFKNHLLSPNPNDPHRTFQEFDNGLRKSSRGGVTDQLTHFRETLRSYATSTANSAGKVNVTIPFDTSTLKSLGGDFLDQGPDFANTSNPESGIYRNKIVWLAVNIVAADGNTPPQISSSKGGRIVYGGNTYFRTRIPVCPDRTPANASGGAGYSRETDFPSEYIVQPFRFFQDTKFDGQFELFDRQNVGSMIMAYSKDSYNENAVKTALTSSIISPAGFRRDDLKERSVAASRWQLDLRSIEIDQIEDIELIIHHIYTLRPMITCP